MTWILFGLAGLFALLLAILLLRTLTFRKKPLEAVEPAPVDFDHDKALSALCELLRCRTVSRHAPEEEDEGEFLRLYELLPRLYPHVLAACTLTRFEGRGLLFRWAGREAGDATVLMAHYDVVPADGEGWRHPPFDAVLEDGHVYGRGTLDTKATFNAVLTAADTLIAQGFTPRHDVYLAFSGSEEISGRGMPEIVSHLAKEGVPIGLVLDEGGAVVEGAFPGVRCPTAMIGIAEKGFLDLEYRALSGGGHASAPGRHTPIGRLAEAITEIERKPARARISPPVREMLRTLGPYASFPYRMVFANLWLFAPLLFLVGRLRGGELGALFRTTVAFTRMSGSEANNVLPSEATVVSNIRLAPGDTIDGTVHRLGRVIDDPRVKLRPLGGINPSRTSRTEGEGYLRTVRAVRAVWPRAVPTPYLMLQCSDSRHFSAISDCVYRFSAMALTKEERATIHGKNERISKEAALLAVEFYLRLLLDS